jgi:tetratricopeptide (TPR) repeat protein
MEIALIILVNLLFYYRTLKYPGICDDIPVFNQAVEIPPGKWTYFWYHLHGRKYKEWLLPHCQVLGIHTLNCILIYIAFGMNYTSLAASLLFAVNPIGNQGSIWLSGKGYAMNLTCGLLMWIFPLASPLIYCYGLYFNGASLILFPLVFLFTKYWWLSFMIIMGFLREKDRIFNKKDPASKFNTESNKELKTLAPRKLIVFFKTMGYYVVNSVTAMRLGFYHKYMFLHGVNNETNKDSYKIDKYFFLGILFALTALVTRDTGLIWFFCYVVMWGNIVSFNQTLTNRYVYAANAGLMLTIATLLTNYPWLTAALWTWYACKLVHFHIFYKNEYWSIEHSCFEQPDFFYPWQNRAVHCFQNNNYQGALGNMIKCDQLRPNDWKVTYNLAQIYMMLGNIQAAKDLHAKASKLMIDGREDVVTKLNERLGLWIAEVEAQAKANNNTVHIDKNRFDLQR